jgi:hypothetical protein
MERNRWRETQGGKQPASSSAPWASPDQACSTAGACGVSALSAGTDAALVVMAVRASQRVARPRRYRRPVNRRWTGQRWRGARSEARGDGGNEACGARRGAVARGLRGSAQLRTAVIADAQAHASVLSVRGVSLGVTRERLLFNLHPIKQERVRGDRGEVGRAHHRGRPHRQASSRPDRSRGRHHRQIWWTTKASSPAE